MRYNPFGITFARTLSKSKSFSLLAIKWAKLDQRKIRLEEIESQISEKLREKELLQEERSSSVLQNNQKLLAQVEAQKEHNEQLLREQQSLRAEICDKEHSLEAREQELAQRERTLQEQVLEFKKDLIRNNQFNNKMLNENK